MVIIIAHSRHVETVVLISQVVVKRRNKGDESQDVVVFEQKLSEKGLKYAIFCPLFAPSTVDIG